MNNIFILFFTFFISCFAQNITFNNWDFYKGADNQKLYYPQKTLDICFINNNRYIDNYNDINYKSDLLMNINVASDPQQVILTPDSKFAFVLCNKGNSITVIGLATKQKIKMLDIPSPNYMLFNTDKSKIFVSSFKTIYNDTTTSCSLSSTSASASLLTVIDVQTQTIDKQITIPSAGGQKVLYYGDEGYVYFWTQYELYKVDLSSSAVELLYQTNSNMYDAAILKNRIFMTHTVSTDSLPFSYLFSFNTLTFEVDTVKIPYSFTLFADSLYNRLLVGGYPSVVVDANSLQIIDTLKYMTGFGISSILAHPQTNTMFICEPYSDGDYHQTIYKVEYSTLNIIESLYGGIEIAYDEAFNRLFFIRKGSLWNSLTFYIIPSEVYYDITQYDLETGTITEYRTTDSLYSCSYWRTIAISNNFNFVVATNSNDNSISILDLSLINSSASDKSSNPFKYELLQNFPNPFNPNTKIKYSVPKIGFVNIKVYDVLGREITTLVNEVKPAGNYEVEFDGRNLSSGVYFYEMQAGSFIDTKKFILIR